MPAVRLPTAMHIAKGSYKKDPQRAKGRENEPVVTDGIGDPPVDWVHSEHGGDKSKLRAIWFELIGDAAPGVLNRSHRMHLETTCRLMAKVRGGYAKTGDYANLNKFLTQMGMNPAAQSTVSGGAFAPAGSATSIGNLARKAQERRAG